MLVEQDAELGQLRQVIGQLQEEEKKMARWVEKLVEELKGKVLHGQSYCWSNFFA